MLNELSGYCEKLTLTPIHANTEGITYKGTINDRFFSLRRKDEIVTITSFDDVIFNAFYSVLHSKYKSLVTCRRKVKLLGETRVPRMVNRLLFPNEKIAFAMQCLQKKSIDVRVCYGFSSAEDIEFTKYSGKLSFNQK